MNELDPKVKLSLRTMAEVAAMPIWRERVHSWACKKLAILIRLKHQQLPPVI